MTAIKILLVLLFAFSCGPQVRLKENKLEDKSLLTKKNHELTGTISKSSKTVVQYQGKTFEISKYSSKEAQNFVAAMAPGSNVAITFTGGFTATEVILETVR